MEGYKTLTEAVASALRVCDSWYGNETEQTYGTEEMSYIAQIIDLESPNTSDEIFYVVFPDGEIGMLCTYDKSIRRLFIPSDSDFVPPDYMLINDGDGMAEDSAMPHGNAFADDEPAPAPQSGKKPEREYYFCIYCGTKVKNGFKFCPNCGGKIEVS